MRVFTCKLSGGYVPATMALNIDTAILDTRHHNCYWNKQKRKIWRTDIREAA